LYLKNFDYIVTFKFATIIEKYNLKSLKKN